MKFSRYTTIQHLKENVYFMVNALSGAVDIIDEKDKQIIDQLIKNGQAENMTIDLMENLKERGYLFADEAEEESYIQRVFALYQKGIGRKAAKIVICPTFLCNLRCVYCFESLDMRKGTERIEPEEVDKIFTYADEIMKQKDLEGYEIELFGGEPLLPTTYETNQRIFEHARKLGKCVSIITNGTQIGIYLELLKEYKDCKKFMISGE